MTEWFTVFDFPSKHRRINRTTNGLGGVNISLGLPIIRTSVDHSTAYDIAWTGKANPKSLINAIIYAKKLIHQDAMMK